MTPAEVLAAAADRLEKLAGEASHGPWIEAGMGEFGWSVIGGDFPLTSNFAVETEDSEQGKADAAYIAAMNPLVGKALADLLRKFQLACAIEEGRKPELWRPPEQQGIENRVPGLMAAIDLARLIVGGES